MRLQDTALVVIDMQNGFVRNGSLHVVPAVVELVKRWQAVGGEVVFTRYLNYPNSPYERLIKWSKMQDAPETDIVDELAPYVQKARAVIDKKIYTLFNEEGSRLVKEAGWTNLVFCGIATESCVLKSAVDAFESGYTPWVVQDASGSHDGDMTHQAGLLVTARFIGSGQIIQADDLIAMVS